MSSKHSRRTLALVRGAGRYGLLAIAGLASSWALAQNISDVPPAVKNNVSPNLMFMIDNSGSMSNIVPSAPYSATATYWGSCSGTALVPAGTSVDINIVATLPRFSYGGNTYRHSSIATGTQAQRCFSNTAIYGARLLGNPTTPSGYLQAQYTGHYLNWYFGNYGGPVLGWVDRKLVLIGAVETRIEVARASAKDVVDFLLPPSSGGAAPLRVGLSTYRSSGTGGQLLMGMTDLTTTSATTLKARIDTLTPTGATPLASTLADIGRYFATGYSGNVTTANGTADLDALLNLNGTDGSRGACLGGTTCTGVSATAASNPIQQWCQRSSVFMMTDGRPQGDRVFNSNTLMRDYDRDCTGANAGSCTTASPNYDRKTSRTYESQGSDYMDDVAKALFDIDLRPNITKPTGSTVRNNLRTYTIGFADTQVLNDPLLVNTAAQGGGIALFPTTRTELTQAFRDAITDSQGKDAAAAAVSVVNAQITVNQVAYTSSYNSGTWFGDLQAVQLDSTTGLPTGAPYWSLRNNLDGPLAQPPQAAHPPRKIVSFDGSVGVPFTAANASRFPAIAPLTPITAGGVINWVRGDRTGEGTIYRQRTSVLGDIINAEAAVVNYDSDTPIIFQPANDGMVHVVDGRTASTVATRGQELWAYVPRMVHDKLETLSSRLNFAHKYLVDGTPTSALVTDGGTNTRMLVGGLGKGGSGYYGLDITSYLAADETAAAAKVRWEFTDAARMGYSFGRPLIVRTSDTSVAGGWRVVVASGYDNGVADGVGYVWVLNPLTGAVIRTISTGVGGPGAAAAGLAHLGKMANTAPDAVVRYVYGGDLLGNVWRFDLNGGTATRIAILTDGAGATQPVTSPPVVGPVSGSSTRNYVYVGTGRYFGDEDIPGNVGVNRFASQTQSMYGIIDDTASASPALPGIRGTNGTSCPTGGGNGDFICQALTAVPSTTSFDSTSNAIGTRRGFYVDLPLAGSRVNTEPALTGGGTLAFTVNVPTNALCDPGGSSYFFTLNGNTGGAIPSGTSGFFRAGEFLRNALSSRPVIIITASDTRGLIKHSDRSDSSRVIPCTNCGGGPPTPGALSPTPAWKRIYWRSLNN